MTGVFAIFFSLLGFYYTWTLEDEHSAMFILTIATIWTGIFIIERKIERCLMKSK